MPAGHELFGVDTFLIGRLKADTTLNTLVGGRVYTDMAPPMQTLPDGTKAPVFPHVLIAFLSAQDRNAIPATARVLTQPIYLVKAVTQDDNWAAANTIADRIDAALLGKEGAVATEGIYVHPLYRQELIRFIETDPSGRRVNHCGARWRTVVTAYP